MNTTKKQHGGARTGSGRKPRFGEPAKQRSFTVPDSLWEWLQSTGVSPSDYVVAGLWQVRNHVRAALGRAGADVSDEDRAAIAKVALQLHAIAMAKSDRASMHVFALQLVHLLESPVDQASQAPERKSP